MVPENFLPIISIIWSLVSGMAAVIAVVWNIRGMVARFDKKIDDLNSNMKADFDAKLLMFSETADSKLKRNYDRLDDYKKLNEERIEQFKKDLELKYVQREMCNIMHTTTTTQFADLKADINRKMDALSANIGKIFDILNDRRKA